MIKIIDISHKEIAWRYEREKSILKDVELVFDCLMGGPIVCHGIVYWRTFGSSFEGKT